MGGNLSRFKGRMPFPNATSTFSSSNDTSSISTASSFDFREPKRQKSLDTTSMLENQRQALVGKIKIALRENNSIHYVIKTLINGNFNAPVNDLLQNGDAKVLEVGCANGNGIWTIDMARDYPLAYFVGVDSNSPINVPPPNRRPYFENMPNNVRFDHADTISTLPYSDDEFDFVFVKMMSIVLPGGNRGWKKFVEELVRVTKPGGFLEIIDPDFKPYNAGPIYRHFYDHFEQALTYQGVDPLRGDSLAKLLDNEPLLSSITLDYVSAPIGWSGKIGTKILGIIGVFIKSLSPELSNLFGLVRRPNDNEYEFLINSCIQECHDREVFYNLHYAYAVKI